MTAAGETTPAAPLPAADVLLRHALKVAIYKARQEEAAGNLSAVRAAAQLVFGPVRRHGTPQQEVRLADGTRIGLISIHNGPETTTVDEDLLFMVAAGNEPADLEEHVKPGALSDPRVLALIKAHLPDYVGCRIKHEAAALYAKEIADNAGKVLDRAGVLGPAGERVRVAEISRGEATGEFTYKPAAKGAQLIREALDAGTLTEDGEFTVPAAEVPAEPEPVTVADADAGAIPPPEDEDSPGNRIERALSHTRARRPPKSGHPPTGEQSDILDAFATGDSLVISAGAGTGKTSSLVMIGEQAAQDDTRKTGIYVAFNRAIVADARPRFGSDVVVSTAHALAMAAVGKNYRHRLNAARVPANQVARILQINEPLRVTEDRVLAPAQQARLVLETVDRFCRSADPELSSVHVPRKPGLDDADPLAVLRTALMPWARKAWADLTAMHGELKYGHDVYLKQWGLSRPQLSADYILYDECQDADPVVQAIVLDQRNTQLIAVGDKSQSLYEWRGAINAMDNFPAAHHLTLSKSFRFGPAIAGEANKWLEILDADLRLTGFERVSSVIARLDAADAVLCRTNAEVISQAMRAIEAGHATAIVGGGKDVRALAEAAVQLKLGRGTSHPELYAFKTWAEVQDHAENDPSGSDLRVLVNLIDANGPERIIEVIDSLTDEGRAQVVISTAHKAKGREWDSVRIANDFHPPKGSEDDPDGGQVSPPDARLAYVAVTRARLSLDRSGLAWVDEYLPERAAAGAA